MSGTKLSIIIPTLNEEENLGQWAVVASPASCLRRAGYLAELGWQRLKRGEADDPATLSPIYLHHPKTDGGP